MKDTSNGAALFAAIRANDTVAVERLLDKGAEVNAEEPESGNTPLHIAAMFGYVDIVNLLLKNDDANVDATAPDGNTPLHIAAMFRNVEIVDLLLKNGANVNATDSKGNTPLQLTVATPYDEPGTKTKMRAEVEASIKQRRVVESLLEHGAKVNGSIVSLAKTNGVHRSILTLLNNAQTVDSASPVKVGSAARGGMFGSGVRDDATLVPQSPANDDRQAFTAAPTCGGGKGGGE